MQLSDEALREFQAIYFAQFGITLTDEEALNAACAVIALVKFVHRVD